MAEACCLPENFDPLYLVALGPVAGSSKKSKKRLQIDIRCCMTTLNRYCLSALSMFFNFPAKISF